MVISRSLAILATADGKASGWSLLFAEVLDLITSVWPGWQRTLFIPTSSIIRCNIGFAAAVPCPSQLLLNPGSSGRGFFTNVELPERLGDQDPHTRSVAFAK